MKLLKTPKIIILSLVSIFTLCQSTPIPEEKFALTAPGTSPKLVEELGKKCETKNPVKKEDPKTIFKKRVYKSAKLMVCSTLAIGAATTGIVSAYFTKSIISWTKSGHIPKIMVKFFPKCTKHAILAMGAGSTFSLCAAWYFLQNAYNIAKGKI